MHQEPDPEIENGAAVETAGVTTRAHPNGVTARKRDDAAGDCSGDGVSLSTVNRAHMSYDGGGIKALKPKPIGGRQRENMTVAEEKTLLARFANAAGAGEMLNVHDLKAAYEQAIGHSTSNSTIYNLLARHGWRKLMPRPFHPKRDLAAQNDFKKTASHRLSGGLDGRRLDAVDGCGSCSPMKHVSAG